MSRRAGRERSDDAALGRFDDAALATITEAVRRTERETSAEIVTYIVGRCDDYGEADWAASVLGAGLGLLAAIALTALTAPPGATASWAGGPSLALALGAGLGAIVGWGLVTLPAVRRLFVPGRVLDGRSRLRAEAAFTDEEVFATRERNGILLFLALFEHRCVVLADRGVRAALDGRDRPLDEVVRVTCAGIRGESPVGGVLAGIDACRRLLVEAGLATPGIASSGDGPPAPGELGDPPRLKDR